MVLIGLLKENHVDAAALKDRYDGSHLAGVHKVLSGDIALFGGVTEAMKNDVIVAMRLQRFDLRIYSLVGELTRLEESLGFKFFLTLRDFPTHVTVQVSVGGHEAKPHLVATNDLSWGQEVSFNRLVLDAGGNIALMNEGVPTWVSAWRTAASQVMSEYGGVPKPLPILHSTVARIMSPANPSTRASAHLVGLVERWNAELQSTPIGFTRAETFVGTVHELLTQKANIG